MRVICSFILLVFLFGCTYTENQRPLSQEELFVYGAQKQEAAAGQAIAFGCKVLPVISCTVHNDKVTAVAATGSYALQDRCINGKSYRFDCISPSLVQSCVSLCE